MYIVEISLKLTPMPFSVQRKVLEDAQGIYDRVLEAMRSGTPQLLELTCEHQPEKKSHLTGQRNYCCAVLRKIWICHDW